MVGKGHFPQGSPQAQEGFQPVGMWHTDRPDLPLMPDLVTSALRAGKEQMYIPPWAAPSPPQNTAMATHSKLFLARHSEKPEMGRVSGHA